MNLERKLHIKASLEKTYRTAENYPLFVESFQDKKIIWSDELSSKVRITNLFFKIPLTWEGEGKKIKNESIHWIQTSGLLKGLRASWIFKPNEKAGTEIVIKAAFSTKGVRRVFLNIVAPILIGKAVNRILVSLKKACENS